MARGRLIRPWALALLLPAACRSGQDGESDAPPGRDDHDDDDGDEPPAFATSGEADESGEPPAPGDASDRCEDAPSIAAGRVFGSLRGKTSALAGACGDGGPDAFFRFDVPRRVDVWLQAVGVGFSPRVGVMPYGCTADWSRRALACTETIGTWLLDAPAGASLVLSVGIDPGDPLLGLPAPEDGVDPLEFALDVALRDVLAAGEPCEPRSRGRCGTGTICAAPSDGDAAGATCIAVAADTCASAAPVAIQIGTQALALAPGHQHSDAHAHSCTGGHRPDRVLRLDLPTALAGLRVTATIDAPEYGLALRGADCSPDAELACAAASASGAHVVADVAASAGEHVYLFVEYPPTATGEDPPPVLRIEAAPASGP